MFNKKLKSRIVELEIKLADGIIPHHGRKIDAVIKHLNLELIGMKHGRYVYRKKVEKK